MKVARIALLALVLLLLYPVWIGFQVWQQSHTDENRRADGIVVLGAAQYDGEPSEVFKARLDQAAFLFEEELAPTVVVTGGKQEGDRFTEAEAGEMYLVEQGVPADRIVGETEGRTTFESLRAVSEMAADQGIQTILLVSDPLHLERIKRMALDLGFEDAFTSYASYERLNRSTTTKVKELIHEVGAIIVYEFLGE
ncbi:MAG TPA: YdcF family protein [Actinomycetota bacterium]|nr:YdcF family protein [Actinomycetota bacterium]